LERRQLPPPGGRHRQDKALFNTATAMTIEEGSLLDIMTGRKTSIGDVVPDPL
jgi:hypothetical protein